MNNFALIRGNYICRYKRPECIAHRNFTPVECLPNDCLVKDYAVVVPRTDGVPASALQTTSDKFKLAA